MDKRSLRLALATDRELQRITGSPVAPVCLSAERDHAEELINELQARVEKAEVALANAAQWKHAFDAERALNRKLRAERDAAYLERDVARHTLRKALERQRGESEPRPPTVASV